MLEELLVAFGATLGLAAPVPGVQGASEHHGVIAAHVVHVVGGDHDRVEAVLTQGPADLGRDSGGRTVLGAVGDQDALGTHDDSPLPSAVVRLTGMLRLDFSGAAGIGTRTALCKEP